MEGEVNGAAPTALEPGDTNAIGRMLGLLGDDSTARRLAPLVRAYEKHILIKSPDLPATLRTRIKLGHFTENDALLGAVGLVLKGQGRLG